MTHISKTAVFFGSGPVAAASLELLLKHTAVEAVITKPRAEQHKGSVPVLEVARAHGLPVVTAATSPQLDEAISQSSFQSTYAILIDFGIIVSQAVIDTFEKGIINSHFSLLPLLRGADPISFAIANGDKKTGVSLMMVDVGMDTGKLLTYRSLGIKATETAPELTNRLIMLSDELLREYVPQYLAGSLLPKSQPHPTRATYSRKLTKQDGVIDLKEPAHVIERKIRAFQPWPRCRLQLFGHTIIVLRAHVAATSETKLAALCGDSKYLVIDQLIAPSGKTMNADAFIRGYLK